MKPLITLLFGLTATFATHSEPNPLIQLDYGTFRGKSDSSTNTDNFLGLPFAVAARLENPRVVGAQDKLQGIQDATQYEASCPQQEFTASPINGNPINSRVGRLIAFIEQLGFQKIANQAEDCLHINVQVPKGAKKGDNLPVFLWFHGGGYEFGSSSALGAETTAANGVIYQGANLVQQSVDMEQPIVFVSANYRLNAFGTLSSKETKAAGIGNLDLKDQREAMRWVNKYIQNFGGDPGRVTLAGESAGSLSIATHMVFIDGDTEGLFHAAIMLSGGVMRLDDYRRGQEIFDRVMEFIGCSASQDKVSCFKQADYNRIYRAVQSLPTFISYESIQIPWYPRPDGAFLRDSPHRLLESGKVANIPYIIGDMKDEGTLFALVNQLNTTTDDEFVDYFNNIVFPNLTRDQVKSLTSLYPHDPTKGSPYDTGYANNITPQYKRLASLIGDIGFESTRRNLLHHTAQKQKGWTYMIESSIPLLAQLPGIGTSIFKDVPLLESFHSADVLIYLYGNIPATVSKNTQNIQTTFISFVNNHDPNHHDLDLPYWPSFDMNQKSMLRFKESGPDIIQDTYRLEGTDWLNNHGDWYRN